MRVVLYDCGYETFAVQYLLSRLEEVGHEAILYFDSSFNKDYLAQDFFLTDTLSLTPQQVAEEILDHEPQVVGFSVYTLFYQENLAVIRHLKQSRPEITIICGGFHSTLLPDRVLQNPEVDFCVMGEAEISLPALLEAVEQHGRDGAKALPREALPGVTNIQGDTAIDRGLSPIPPDLNALPFPEKKAYYAANPTFRSIYTIVAGRGCPYNCTYCNSATMNELYRCHSARYYRTRSVDNVIAELRYAKEHYKPRYVMFFDDVFAAKREWREEFAERYRREVGLPYYCQTSPLIHDSESLALLARSGCVLLEFGFQSADDTVRRKVLNRRESNEGMKTLLKAAIRSGMFTELDLIANLPGEKEDHLRAALDFILETRPHWVNLAFLQFHPRTPITDKAVEAGMLSDDDVERIQEGRYASSMRLLSKSNLGPRYRVLPFQVFAACRLPGGLARRTIRWVEWAPVAWFCSALASPFLYISRIALSYTDRRDFLIRHHVVRSMVALRVIVGRKIAWWKRDRRAREEGGRA